MHYLVIHADTDDRLDIAEVEADNVNAACAIVAGYEDTAGIISAIESTTPLSSINYHIVREYQGLLLIGQLLPTEGNDLPPAEPQPEGTTEH